MSVVFIDFQEDDPSAKINLCRYRSVSKESGTTGCCGGRKQMTGFKCLKRNIFPLKDSICQDCSVFEQKE